MNQNDQNQSLSRQNMRVCEFFYIKDQLIYSKTACYSHDSECELCENSYLKVEWRQERRTEALALQLQTWSHCLQAKECCFRSSIIFHSRIHLTHLSHLHVQ